MVHILKLFVLTYILSGCGLSPTYQYDSLKSASSYDVCYAITDPRRNMPMSGWAVRAEAARKVAYQRGISCDQEQFSRTHARDVRTRAVQQEQTDRALQRLQRAFDGGGSAGGSTSRGGNNYTLCPDGSYVSGELCHLCPDGSYVGAYWNRSTSCRLMPDGSYIGR